MKAVRFLFILFLIVSCSRKEQHPYTFYYWKTNLKLDREEKTVLDKAPVPFLYTRFFDVDKIGENFNL